MPDPIGQRPEQPRCSRLSGAFAASSVALGAVVLLGWALGFEGLTRVFPGMITMKPNTALAFLLAGLAGLSILEGRGHVRRAIGLSLAVAAVGGASLFEHASGVDLGIDELLFREPANALRSLHPGRMQPTTAFDFLALGMASALLAADREHRAAQAMILLAAFVAGSTLIGYLYGVREFVGLATFSQMAVHTTLGMLAVSAGLLLARPTRGMMASIADDGPGGLMARWLMPVAILTPIVTSGLMILAREAGMFDERFGSAVRVTFVIAIFVACIWRSSHSLHRIDADLRHSYASLEDRVAGRTAELSLANDQLREGEQRFRTLADSIPQLAWMARPDGYIFWYNRRWYDYTGTTLEQMQGWGWQSVHDPSELPRVVETIKVSFASGDPWDCTFPLRRHDGAFRWHLSRMLPVKDEQGQVVLWFGSNTDVDDQKQVEDALRKAKEAAEAATRAKAEFLANMSHEIRTPMNGVLGMTELALATDLTPRQREYLGLVKSSADALLTVIDDILDFSKIEAGKLNLESIGPSTARDRLGDTSCAPWP